MTPFCVDVVPLPKQRGKTSCSKPQKPYLHESRHQHSLRCPRVTDGLFLNTKKESNGNDAGGGSKATFSKPLTRQAASSSSEIHKSDLPNPSSACRVQSCQAEMEL